MVEGTQNQGEAGLDVDAIYRRYAPLVYRRILRLFGESEAEEVLHEVFMKVIERGDTFRQESSPTTWLYRITTNHCLNRLRNTKRRGELLERGREELFPSGPREATQLDQVFWRELWHHVDAELLQIAVHCYVDGLSHLEIANMYGVSRRTIGNRLAELQRQVGALAGLG